MYTINNDVSSKSNIKPNLAGNRIVTATFEGVEYREVLSKKGETWNLITMKFSNEEGIFEDSTFEPKAGDDKRLRTGEQKFLNVSVVEEIMAKFRHLIAAVNPDLDAQIEAKTKTLNASSWKALGLLMEKATVKGKGKQVQLKLMADKDGNGVFPRFFLALSKAEQPYMRTNFIAPVGAPLAFTEKEKERIKTVATAKPSTKEQIAGLDDVDIETDAPADDISFNLEDL